MKTRVPDGNEIFAPSLVLVLVLVPVLVLVRAMAELRLIHV